MLALGVSSPCPAGVEPVAPERLAFECVFKKTCFVGQKTIMESKCREDVSTIVLKTHGKGFSAQMTRPNGSVVSGLAGHWGQYQGIDYLNFVSGSGSGGGFLTIYPDKSAAMTSHFTLNGNVAVSYFGACEELQ